MQQYLFTKGRNPNWEDMSRTRLLKSKVIVTLELVSTYLCLSITDLGFTGRGFVFAYGFIWQVLVIPGFGW